MRIPGPWDDGFALDFHTSSSVFVGHDATTGHPVFETQRPELGERLFQLKYRGDRSAVAPIAEAAAGFLRSWSPGIEVVVPAPPSRARSIQPLIEIAAALGGLLDLPVEAASVRRIRETPELKDLYEYGQRLEALAGAHTIDGDSLRGRRVLLLDDLYRSGATLNALTRLVRAEGGASAVFALALTRTRSSS